MADRIERVDGKLTNMAEAVTGQAWEDSMRRLVFEPLGMTTMGFGAPGRGQPCGHTANGCEAVSYLGNADNPAVIGPAGTVHGTLADGRGTRRCICRAHRVAPGCSSNRRASPSSTAITSARAWHSAGVSWSALGPEAAR